MRHLPSFLVRLFFFLFSWCSSSRTSCSSLCVPGILFFSFASKHLPYLIRASACWWKASRACSCLMCSKRVHLTGLWVGVSLLENIMQFLRLVRLFLPFDPSMHSGPPRRSLARSWTAVLSFVPLTFVPSRFAMVAQEAPPSCVRVCASSVLLISRAIETGAQVLCRVIF